MFCNGCGTENPDTAKFCRKCGSTFVEAGINGVTPVLDKPKKSTEPTGSIWHLNIIAAIRYLIAAICFFWAFIFITQSFITHVDAFYFYSFFIPGLGMVFIGILLIDKLRNGLFGWAFSKIRK